MASERGPDGTGPDGTGPSGRRSGRRRVPWAVEWLAVAVVAVVVAIVVRTYVAEMFYIPSGSMEPTLQIGDRIIVDKLSYDLHAIHRGDIVVFRRPPLEPQDFADLVKRVIGLPGETISSHDGSVYIDGKKLAEPWLPPGTYTGALPGDPHPQFNLPGPVVIPKGEYYVMGDNREDSQDSRYFGPIPRSLIVGKRVAIVWPISHDTGIFVALGVVIVVLVAIAVLAAALRRRQARPRVPGRTDRGP